MPRDAFAPKYDLSQLPLDLGHELIIDNFAGGGGTSTGLEAAFGRPVDIAINHDPEALAMHAMNHPYTKHYCESVWDVDPIEVTQNRPVGLVWLSPDCKHFSKAKGGTPVSKNIRGLAWVTLRWAAKCKPRAIALENVIEMTTWGPLLVDENGDARPDPTKRGTTFKSFIRQLRGHGYEVDWRELSACDYGAGTLRKRLFVQARRDGVPITWPKATHGDPTSREVLAGHLLPWTTAAESIDFTIPAKSIFGRKKDLAYNTHRRVAKGLWRHVLTSAKPYVVSQSAANDPTGIQIGESAVAATLSSLRGTSESHLTGGDVEAPLTTICASGTHHALIGARLVNIGEDESNSNSAGDKSPGHFSGQQTIAMSCIEQANGGFYEGDGRPADAPLSTITAAGSNQRLITAYCVKYYSNGGQWQELGVPMHTLPTKARMGLVQAMQVSADSLAPHLRERAKLCAQLLQEHLPEHFPNPVDFIMVDGWVLVDITLRMLKPRELYRAQSFPESYVIDKIPNPAKLFEFGQQVGHPHELPSVELTGTSQVRMCGNSVAPLVAYALGKEIRGHELQYMPRAA